MSDNEDLNPAALAKKERRSAQRLDRSRLLGPLGAALVLWLVGMIAPFAGSVRGFQVVTHSAAATAAGITATEYIFSILVTVGVGLLTSIALATRRAAVALVAWMFCTAGIPYTVFALWLRQTRENGADGVDTQVGFWLLLIATVLASVSYFIAGLRRSPEREKIAHQRAAVVESNEISQAQQAALEAQRGGWDAFIDDRRAQAARKHQRYREASD